MGSDLDLVVEGLAPARFFAVAAALAAEAGELEVDLVPLESCRPLFLEHVAREGALLWPSD